MLIVGFPAGRQTIDGGPPELAYDIWWSIRYDQLLTSEWRWLWHPDGDGGVVAKKVITIAAEPAQTERLRPAHRRTAAARRCHRLWACTFILAAG